MQDSNFGFDINLTMVTNDLTNFDAGIKMTCSDGFRFDRTYSGISMDDAVNKISDELDREYGKYLDSITAVSVEGNSVEDRLKRLEMENERLRQELVAAKAKSKGKSEPDRAESVGPEVKMPERKKSSRVEVEEEFGKDIVNLLKMFM